MVLYESMDRQDMLCFQTYPSTPEITLWLENPVGTESSDRLTVPVHVLQEALRTCAAVDEGTIRWLGDMELRMGAIRVKEIEYVTRVLGLRAKTSQ